MFSAFESGITVSSPPMRSIRPLPHSTSMRPRHNWMQHVANRTLFDITIPGSHHSASGTIAIARPSLFICRRHAQCQSLSVLEQLRAGIRCLDVRLRVGSDGVIRASHSNRASLIELEFLFMSLDDVVREIASFLEDNHSEVVFLKIRMDFRAPDLGSSWQLVHDMLQPLRSKMLPFSQRMNKIGEIARGGHHLCVVCRQLRDAFGDIFWPWDFFAGSWDLTCSCRWQDLYSRLRSYVAAHSIVTDGSRVQYIQGEITQKLSTAVKGSLRSDAELANAVLLDLLQDAWIGIPLQIVTQDYCNDAVIEALVSRNMVLSPFDGNFPSRGSVIKSPDEFRSSEVLISDDGRYMAALSEHGVLNIISKDNVLCFSASFAPVPTAAQREYSLVPSAALSDYSLSLSTTDTLVCACHGDIVWKAERGFHVPSMTAMISKLSPFHCCGSSLASTFSQVLVLTNAGELHVERHHDVGNFTVEWSSNNRLIKFS